MGTIDSLKSVLTQSALDALCEKFHIPDVVHPELPGPNARIRNSPTGKIGVYSRFFDFANYRIPLSQFLIDILQYFQINLSQLSVIAAAKVSHFEILCRVHGFVLTVGNFRIFYINSENKGWMCFSKRAENAPVCYTRPLDSLKNWNDHFFWIDAFVLPHAISWHSSKTVNKDPHPIPDEFDADVCIVLRSRKMDLFAFIRHADPTKIKIGDSEVREGEVLLLELTRGRVIPLAGGIKLSIAVLLSEFGGIDIEVDVEAQALVADKPKKFRKKKTADGASGSGHPPKRLREDHDTFGDVCASTAGKTLAALQDLLDKSTLAAEIGVTTATTVPFVTSSVTPTPEHEGGEYTDSVSAANFRTKHSAGRSVVPGPIVLTTAVATTFIPGTSVPQPKEVNEPMRVSIFADSTSAGNIGPDVAKPSQPAGNDISSESFYVSLDMDSETLHQTYVLKWDVLNESALDEPNVYRSLVDPLAPPVFFSQLSAMEGKKRLEGKCGMQAILLKEMDTEIAGLKAQLSLKEAEAVEAIRLQSRIADIEASHAILTGELKSLKKRNAALESATVSELETTCSRLRDKVAGCKLFKEQVEVVHDEQVKELSDRCLQSSEYLVALGGALGRAIDKGMQDGLKAGVDYGRSGIGLDVIAAYDPSAEANFVSTVDDLCTVKFPLLAQLESRKDASMADIFDLLHLEGPAAETLKASQLQPSFEQLMVPIHRLEDQVVIGETSLSFALDVAHSRVQRLKGDVAACRLSLTDAMVPLLEPPSVRSLTGEASTSMVSSTAVTTLLSTTFVQASIIPPVPSTEVPPSPKIVFEEELDTMPEHASAP
nr:hypothetical protein [Tanacetum cinerariifolium]